MMHPMISARAFNSPLLIDPRKAAAIMQGLGPRILGSEISIAGAPEPDDRASAMEPRASILDGAVEGNLRRWGEAGYAVINGAAVIPVTGVLVHRGAWIGNSSGQTSYEGLRAQIDAAAADPQVAGIALEIDTYGGEVAGCFDLADRIREVGQQKPVRAFVAEHAYSAGYALASQCDQVVLPRTGGVGSIGVICIHADFSGALDDAGVKVTIIAAGEHKADGNPYEALPESVRKELAGRMETMRGLFCTTVGAGRGSRFDALAARATEAACFDGEAAVEAGFADRVVAPRAAFLEFIEELNGASAVPMSGPGPRGTQAERRTPMTNTPDNDERLEDQTDAGPAEDEEETTEGDGGTDENGAANERERVRAIVTSEAAKGRESLAQHLALNTDLSPEVAKGVLEAAATEAKSGALSSAMAGDDTDLGDGDASGGSGKESLAGIMGERYGKAA